MTISDLDIQVGGKVFRKDGMDGKITAINPGGEAKICIKYYDGSQGCILTDADLDDYYLLGTTVLGNKCTEEYIEAEIEKVNAYRTELVEQREHIEQTFAITQERTPELYDAYLAKLEQNKAEKQAADEKHDCLTRQRWNLSNRMIPEWREKQGKK